MKINNSIFLIKLFFLLLIISFLHPIKDFHNFYIFLFCVTIIIFSKIKYKIHYFKAIILIFFIILIKYLHSTIFFHEGNNVVILNDNSKAFYEENLPIRLFNFFEKEYDFYNSNSDCLEENQKCWRSFDPTKKLENALPIYQKFSPALYFDIKKTKYSRKLKDLNIIDIKSARITEVNNLRYNYFWGDKYDIVRENLPFSFQSNDAFNICIVSSNASKSPNFQLLSFFTNLTCLPFTHFQYQIPTRS